ncbi:MAG: ABC transporter ATP-binding protein [Bacteroidales bacterium]|nr:ABC transporter ATP-binding protein [Bacteroidales bacterium]
MKEHIRYILRALKLIWLSSPKWAIFNSVFIVLRGSVPLMMLWVIKLLVDTTDQQLQNNEFDIHEVIFVLSAVGILFVINSLTASLHSIVRERQTFCLNRYLSDIIHNKTTSVGYSFFEDANYQNIYYRAVSDARSKPQQVFYNMVGVLQNGFTLGAIAIILISIYWLMPVIIVLVALPIIILRIHYSRKYFKMRREQTSEERELNYYNRVLTAKEFAKEVRLFSLGDLFRKKYQDVDTEIHKSQRKLLVTIAIREAILQFVISLLMIVVFGFLIWQATKGDMTVGSLAMYFMAIHRGYTIVQDLLQRIASLYENNLFLRNVFEFLDMKIDKEQAHAKFPTLTKGISLRNVSFKYPNTSRTALKNLNLDIRNGETLAVVGNNGSGKSTLLKIICGLYKPTEGQVFYDGVDLAEISDKEISKNVSAIFQDFVLYNVTARDNIWYGNIDAPNDDAEIQSAARSAGIDKVFAELKNGYDTRLGNLFPDGEMLSQGEWQRTALARSFFNKSQVIVMDEPTSSLDAFTQADLTDNFRAITQNRTAIIVSHRLSTIRVADRIAVVNDKHIVEIGTYDELMAQKGFLYRMVQKLEH